MTNVHVAGISSQTPVQGGNHHIANNGDVKIMTEPEYDFIAPGHQGLQFPERACQDAEERLEKPQVLEIVSIRENLHKMEQALCEDDNLHTMEQAPCEDDVCSSQYSRIYISPIYDGPKEVDLDMYEEMQRLKLELQRQDLEIQSLKAHVERLKSLLLDEATRTIQDNVSNNVMPPKIPMKACESECHCNRMRCLSNWLQDTPPSHTKSLESMDSFVELLAQVNASGCETGRRVQVLKGSMEPVRGRVLRTGNGQRPSVDSQSNSSSVVERTWNLFFSSVIVSVKNLSNNISVDEPGDDLDFFKSDLGAIEGKLGFFKKILSQLEQTCKELNDKNPVVKLRNSLNPVDKMSQQIDQTEVEVNTTQASCVSNNNQETQVVKHEFPTAVQELIRGNEEQRAWVEELLSINEGLLELLQAKEEKLGLLSTKVQMLRSRNKEAAEEIARLSQKVAGQQKALRVLKEDEVGLRSKNEILKLKLACTEYELASQQLALERLSCLEANEAGSRRSKRNESRLRRASNCIDGVEEMVLCMKAEVSKAIEGMRVIIVESV